MKVFLFGNVGAGKTTISLNLKNRLNWQILAIDDYRRRFGDGSKEREILAQQHFFRDLNFDVNQIIETLGVGKVSEQLFNIVNQSDESFICIILTVPKEVCKTRVLNRKEIIPFPKNPRDIFPLIDRVDERIENREIEAIWGDRGNTSIFRLNNLVQEDIDMVTAQIIDWVLCS